MLYRKVSEFIKFRVFFKFLFRRILGWIFFQLNFLSVVFFWKNFSSRLPFIFTFFLGSPIHEASDETHLLASVECKDIFCCKSKLNIWLWSNVLVYTAKRFWIFSKSLEVTQFVHPHSSCSSIRVASIDENKNSHRKITMAHSQTTCINRIAIRVGKKGRPAEVGALASVFEKSAQTPKTTKMQTNNTNSDI